MPVLKLVGTQTAHLSAVDLEVSAAECVCVTGASGSGKSLLLRAIADLDPHHGHVYLDEHEQYGVSPQQWRSWVGLLPAESQWWYDDVGAHFASNIESDAFTSWLATLGFERDVLSWQVSRLSSGERQRLSLLRLLSYQPKALLLDEPSANLDLENTQKTESLISSYRLHYRTPVLWVSHDDEQIKRVAARHFHIEQGQLQQVAQ